MKTRMVEEREGELLGPVDWSHNFRQHFDNYCSTNEQRDKRCAETVALLKRLTEMIAEGKRCRIQCYDFSHSVITVGMYDGWPYWKPTPAILVNSPIGGGDWKFFYDLTAVREDHRP